MKTSLVSRVAVAVFSLATFLFVGSASAQVATVAVKGAEVGKWTQDYDAAKKLAAEKKLPLLVNFTGSDWCGWCKLMDRQVFAEDEWKNWASNKVVLAYINFPRNEKLVPEEFVNRNKALQKEFGVRGYPTYVILNNDGVTVLGQLSASRDATPASFIKQLEAVLAEPPKLGPRVK